MNLAIPWVIIGHSERRLILNESNEVIPARMETSGHTPIFILLTFCGNRLFQIRKYVDSKTIPPSFLNTVCRRQSCICTFSRH